MTCLGKFREIPRCYACDPYMRAACRDWKDAFNELRLAQNSITLAIDALEQSARALEQAIGREEK